ncbi:hypothetical protein PHA77_18350 (plasmid) [Edwardsiella tarda]|uniref:FitA-like ribbon-helix-helix domain-containing protein n=1 Tax=Edwardsiella tarda TaxID=636 RepID=UPI0024443ADF|nr:hypothetical protein [Edwardsiella tarda]WGE30861.1 hypothetical protein PHA77_17210 [Edwardsiella tarda]WGE30992.1 hypothetical protein PHA77_18350 [Edwardsiella tarda]
MAKIQARNVDDALFQRIEQSAMRNERSLEGEVRIALAKQYPAMPTVEIILSSREQWQKDCGRRLQAALDRLSSDGFFSDSSHNGQTQIADWVRIARRLDISPGVLMDCIEGVTELPHDLAARIERQFSVNAEWLMTGKGMMFPMVSLGMNSGVSWEAFFLPDDDVHYLFELIHITGGNDDGALLILRQNEQSGVVTMGMVSGAFYLGAKMGSGGYGALKRFFVFLNTHCRDVVMNAYVFEPPEPDVDSCTAMGQHHSIWFRNANWRSPSRWLQQILNGEDPGEWFSGGWSSVLDEIVAARRDSESVRLAETGH